MWIVHSYLLSIFPNFFKFFMFSNGYRVAQHHIQDPNILMLKNNEHLRRTRLSFKIFNNFRVKDKNVIMNTLFLQLTEILQCKKMRSRSTSSKIRHGHYEPNNMIYWEYNTFSSYFCQNCITSVQLWENAT